RSPDRALLGIGLHTARELPGLEVTEALAAELRQATADRQAYLLLALSDRGDAAVFPAVVEAAMRGSPKLRFAAVGVLDRMGNPAGTPARLEAASSGEGELASAALAALARLPGNKVDSDLLARIPESSGKTRQVLIELVGQRRIEAGLPAVVQSADDADAGVRGAAVRTIGVLGG